MIIKLPEEFMFTASGSRGNAYVTDGILYIKGYLDYENLMYTIAYAIHGYDHCYYCGKKLTHRKRTLDHMFPKAWGGISIPDNLLPCCDKCNNEEKRDMTYNQFLRWKSFSTEKEKSTYYKEAIKRNLKTIRKGKLQLPNYWVTDYDISDVLNRICFNEISKKECQKIAMHYEENGGYPRPIIVTSNGWVLKGFSIVYHAKEHGINSVPAVVLENVVKI